MYTFPKKEHLCGNRKIENLYENGKSFLVFPLRVVYFHKKEPEDVPAQAMVSVSKKKFKRAVKRNRIKRLMRETYRLNKQEIIDFAVQNNIVIHLAFQYISVEEENFHKLSMRMQLALKKLTENIQNEITPENN